MSRFIPVSDVIDDLCLRSGDTLRRNKGLFLSCCDDVWNDLNESTLRIAKRLSMPVRKEFIVNKRTNSIDMPCDFLKLSSVSVRDNCGIIYPVYRNRNIADDIVELPASKNCACEHNCGNQLCNTIKGYVAVQNVLSDSLPNGNPISFNCISRISCDKNGFVYQENQYPKRIYTNGVWVDTILYTESTKICQCDVDTNGCIYDTPQNINTVCNSCGIKGITSNINPDNYSGLNGLQPLVGGDNDGIPTPPCPPAYNNSNNNGYTQPCIGGNASCPPDPNCGEWIYYCDNKMDWFGVQCGCDPCGFANGRNNVYNIGEKDDRLVFPPDFGFDKVLVRYYQDIDLSELQIPYMAKETFMKGLQYFATNNNEKKIQIAKVHGDQYSRLKYGLFLEMNKYRITELGNAISPKAYVPSYRDHREDRWYGWY